MIDVGLVVFFLALLCNNIVVWCFGIHEGYKRGRYEFEKLQRVVKDLYFSAYWKSDRLEPTYEKILWERVRDEALIQPGQTSAILGQPRWK